MVAHEFYCGSEKKMPYFIDPCRQCGILFQHDQPEQKLCKACEERAIQKLFEVRKRSDIFEEMKQ
jgi:hypothetical protein